MNQAHWNISETIMAKTKMFWRQDFLNILCLSTWSVVKDSSRFLPSHFSSLQSTIKSGERNQAISKFHHFFLGFSVASPWFWNTDARWVGETSKWIDNITRLMLDVWCEAFSIGGSIIWWFPVELHRLWCVSNTDTPTPAGRGWINAMHHCSELSSEICFCFVGIQCILYNYTSANLLCDCNLLIHTRKHFLQLFLLSHLSVCSISFCL